MPAAKKADIFARAIELGESGEIDYEQFSRILNSASECKMAKKNIVIDTSAFSQILLVSINLITMTYSFLSRFSKKSINTRLVKTRWFHARMLSKTLMP